MSSKHSGGEGGPGQEAQGAPLLTVTQVAAQLGATARAIRFYEDKGLITPQRIGTTRVYGRREVARMTLILRGKRLGFSLREIKEFLDLYDVDSTQKTQMRRLIENVRRGDTVIMTGGLIGKVTKVAEGPEIEIEIADNVKVKIIRSMIAEVRSKSEPVKSED